MTIFKSAGYNHVIVLKSRKQTKLEFLLQYNEVQHHALLRVKTPTARTLDISSNGWSIPENKLQSKHQNVAICDKVLRLPGIVFGDSHQLSKAARVPTEYFSILCLVSCDMFKAKIREILWQPLLHLSKIRLLRAAFIKKI